MSDKQMAPYLGPKALCAVAMLACLFDVVSIAVIIYRQYVWAVKISHHGVSSLFDTPNLISMSISLCPMIVVVIARHIAPIVISYASMLFVIMAGQIYYLLPPRLIGVDGLALKFTWSDLCLSLLEISSSVAVAVWVIVRLVTIFNSILKRLKGAQ